MAVYQAERVVHRVVRCVVECVAASAQREGDASPVASAGSDRSVPSSLLLSFLPTPLSA